MPWYTSKWGVFSAYVAIVVSTVMASMYKVLFKVWGKRQEKDGDTCANMSLLYFNYFLMIATGLEDAYILYFLPVTIYNATHSLPIALAILFARYMLPDSTRLNARKMIAIFGICTGTVFAVLYGPLPTNDNYTDIFYERYLLPMVVAAHVVLLLTMAIPLYIIRFTNCDLQFKSVCVSLMTSGLCAISTVTTKLIIQAFSDLGHGERFDDYDFWLIAFYIFALWLQLKATAYMFGFFDTTMTIATYGALLVLIPTTYGIIVFAETPINWLYFILANLGTMVCVVFLYFEQDEKYEPVESDREVEPVPM